MVFKKVSKLFLTSAYLYYKDRLNIRSNAIAYSFIIAIIPLFTILIKFANINEKQLLENINRLLTIYGISGTQPILDIVQDILNRSNTISGIGLLFLIYSVLNIFVYLEDSANQIFRARSRGFLMRTSVFTTWVVFFPLIIIFLFDISRNIQKFLSPSNFISVTSNQKNIFLFKDKLELEIFSTNFELENRYKILDKIDFLALNRKIIINDEEMTFDISGDIIKSVIKEPIKFIVDRDFQIVAIKPSIILFTQDNGLNWDYRFFIFSNKGKSFELPLIEDIKNDEENLYFLLTYGNQSYFLILDRNYMEIKKKYIFQNFYNLIYVDNNQVFLFGQGNYISIDLNKTIYEIQNIPNLNTTFENLYSINNQFLILTKQKRIVILNLKNRVIEYPILKINQFENIHNFKIFDNHTGFLFGKKDFRFTMDISNNQTLGKEWFIARFYDDSNNEVQLEKINDVFWNGDSYILVGDNQSIYIAKVFSISTDPKTDLKIIKLRIFQKYLISNYKKILPNIVYNLINYFYILIFLTFFYIILPNRKIPVISAFIGGIFSSSGIIIFMIIFNIIVPFFTTSKIIYGIWFAIPISLIVLLSTIQIFLFGLEITRVHMHPELMTDNIFQKFKDLIFGNDQQLEKKNS